MPRLLEPPERTRTVGPLLLPWLALAGAAAVISPLLLAAMSRREVARRDASMVAAPAQPVTALATAVEPTMIDIEVDVRPETAAIVIDGVAVEGNPFAARVVRDGLTHDIYASAPGYPAQSTGMMFAGNITLHLDLERYGTQRWPAPAPPPPAPAQADPPTPPSVAAGLLKRGQALYRRYQYQQALGDFQDAYTIGHSLEALYYVGMSYGRLDNFPDAVVAFERWLSEADATALHRIDIEQTVGRLKLRIAEKAAASESHRPVK